VDVNQHWWTRRLENLYTVLNHLEWNKKDQKWFQFSVRRIRMEEFEDSRRFSRDMSGNWPDGRFGSRCCTDEILPIGWSESYRERADDEQWNPIGIPLDLESGMEGDEVDDTTFIEML
jgi:hypothetical protein